MKNDQRHRQNNTYEIKNKIRQTNEQNQPRNKQILEIEQYINNIDFSSITDDSVLSNIYVEISDNGTQLATNPYTTTSLERLVLISNASQLVPFLRTLHPRTIYKKLGSRIVESIIKRLFECMYVRGESFMFKDVVDNIDFMECIRNQDAVHVIREVIMLLTGRKVEGLCVEKYSMTSTDDSSTNKEQLDNKTYATAKLQEYKEGFSKALKNTALNDFYITLKIFLQCTKSQSLIRTFLENDCNSTNIIDRGFVYEALASISNKTNLEFVYACIKKNVMMLSTNDKSSYFMACFIRHYKQPNKILRRMSIEQFERNSNVVLSLLEALQREKKHEEVKQLMVDFYKVDGNAFEKMVLGREEGLDTKYIDVMVQFMAMSGEQDYNVNADFVRYFRPEWVGSKAGRKLLVGFVFGGAARRMKKEFLNDKIDLFWKCSYWKKDGRVFIRKVVEYTEGHSRKKAFEILGTFKG